MIDSRSFNPDVLSCLANLSNDEVFTPPDLANKILDLLPASIWADKNATFLDPCSKTGVFLREIAKRLLTGLEQEIPDLHERINHIFKNQLFGIAITELTAHLTRRSVYCSKHANGDYSVCPVFDDDSGNILFSKIAHTWKDGRCVFCGASAEAYKRGDELETHAYQFIHTGIELVDKENTKTADGADRRGHWEEIFKMKFDVIVGNPPYQMSTGSASAQATPLYHKFVQQAKKMNPRYLTMIIPARWYAGGMGLDDFRKEMLNDNKIRKLIDYTNAKDCFNGIELRGGVCYFLWDRDNNGLCEYKNNTNGIESVSIRDLTEFPIFVRYNQSINIIYKIEKLKEKSLSGIISAVSPFGIKTSTRGMSKIFENSAKLYSSGGIGYISLSEIIQGKNLIDKYKVLLTRPISGNLETPPFKVIATLKVLQPNEICTHSYLVAGLFNNRNKADNLKSYLETKFSRFLLVQCITGIDISKDKFFFVPMQDFSEPWTDEKLYTKYGLTQEEIAFIESMIRPMEVG